MKEWTEEEFEQMEWWQKKAVLDAIDQNYCYLCGNSRYICPGCTGGMIGLRNDELFTSCGFEMRCPECVGYDKAVKDFNDIQKVIGRELTLGKDNIEINQLSRLG